MSNTIDWGKIHYSSWSPETNLTGTASTPSFSNTQSVEFDGVDDYVDCGNPASLQITGALTISAWVKMSLSAGNQTPILSKDNISARCFALWASVLGASNPIFIIFNNNTSTRVDATTNIKDNSWHHILVAFNPSTSLSIYVDGVLEGINTTSIPSSIDNDAVNFEIGRLTPSYKFNGNIDEIAVWNSDQSSNVSSIYNGGIPSDLSSYSPLSSWRFEGTGTTATDSGSGGNDGTLTNGVTRSTDVPT